MKSNIKYNIKSWIRVYLSITIVTSTVIFFLVGCSGNFQTYSYTNHSNTYYYNNKYGSQKYNSNYHNAKGSNAPYHYKTYHEIDAYLKSYYQTIGETKYEGVYKEGYTVQAGAFSSAANAGKYTDKLVEKGLDAFMFVENNYYKVRVGSLKTAEEARQLGEKLKSEGLLNEYYIVNPKDYSYARSNSGKKPSTGSVPTIDSNRITSGNYLRDELVRTAYKYIGTPYVWGGNSEAGIDCSGLTRAVYRLNGLSIPRVSRDQFKVGKKVSKSDLQIGDLVFFATGGGRRVSHVGVYVGDGLFIHAPRKGTKVRTERLNTNYWNKVYMGARSYI